MAVETGTGEVYATAIEELWSGLAHTLVRLEVTAAEPNRLGEVDAPRALRRLQYALHLAGEHTYGIVPPAGAERAHAELTEALGRARDATAEVAAAVDEVGPGGAPELLADWRAALLRVRLARTRLLAPAHVRTPQQALDEWDPITRPLIAFLLALLGAVAFVAGATLGLWPVWTAGSIAVCISILAYRP